MFQFFFIINIHAQVVRTPQVFYTPAFSGECGLIPDADSWISFRHILNQQEEPEPLSEWVFNADSIIYDLRLLFYLNLDPFLPESGFQHDCKHEVDRSSVRMQIHDIIFFIFRPLNDIVLLG